MFSGVYGFCWVDAVVIHHVQDLLGDVEPEAHGLAFPGGSVDVDCVYDGFVSDGTI